MQRYLVAAILAAGFPLAATAPAVGSEIVLYESATLGPTGITLTELTSGTVPGINIGPFVYRGARFKITQPVVMSRIGGHFAAGNGGGNFFGAVVALESADDLPDSFDLSTPDLLGTALLEFPALSADVYGNLSLALEPGWYAAVFGSGLFGANGAGGVVRNSCDKYRYHWSTDRSLGRPATFGCDWLPVCSDRHGGARAHYSMLVMYVCATFADQ